MSKKLEHCEDNRYWAGGLSDCSDEPIVLLQIICFFPQSEDEPTSGLPVSFWKLPPNKNDRGNGVQAHQLGHKQNHHCA